MNYIKTFEYSFKSDVDENFTDTYLLNKKEGNTFYFHVYDANFFPSSDFSTWSKSAIDEVVDYVKEKFKGNEVTIYLDSYKVEIKGE